MIDQVINSAQDDHVFISQLVGKYAKMVFGIGYHLLGDYHLAEDVAHFDVLQAIASKLAAFAG